MLKRQLGSKAGQSCLDASWPLSFLHIVAQDPTDPSLTAVDTGNMPGSLKSLEISDLLLLSYLQGI